MTRSIFRETPYEKAQRVAREKGEQLRKVTTAFFVGLTPGEKTKLAALLDGEEQQVLGMLVQLCIDWKEKNT